MQIKKILSFCVMCVILSACGCKNSYMAENYIVKPRDKYMDCDEIIYAINEAEFWMRNVNERCMQPHVFAKFFPCTPMVKLDAMRNEYTLSDRADYLKSLYRLKGCERAVKLNNASISKQASKIAQYNSNRGLVKNIHQKDWQIAPNKIIAELPANIK